MAGAEVGIDAPQAARIMVNVVQSKVIRNRWWYTVSPSSNMSETKQNDAAIVPGTA